MTADTSVLSLYLASGRIDSDAIAHIKYAAEFRPPPHKRKIDDSNTKGRGNICGNAPYGLSAKKQQGNRGRQFTDKQGTLHSKRQLHLVDISPRASGARRNRPTFRKVSPQEALRVLVSI
jgi:hypothetical protein